MNSKTELLSKSTWEWNISFSYPFTKNIIYAAAVYYNSSFYVFGGKTDEFENVRLISKFDSSSHEWSKIGEFTYSRHHHKTVLVGQEFISIGGNQSVETCSFGVWYNETVLICEPKNITFDSLHNFHVYPFEQKKCLTWWFRLNILTVQ